MNTTLFYANDPPEQRKLAPAANGVRGGGGGGGVAHVRTTMGKSLKILLFLFTLNSISLLIYFSSHPFDLRRPSAAANSIHHRHAAVFHSSSSTTTNSRRGLPVSVKPWPILPSYLPWTQNSADPPPYRSCEAYFGNGFNQKADLLPPIGRNRGGGGGGGGWFRCFYSQTLRSSVCEGGGIRMVPERIAMSRGGERLESVIGRGEDEEMPNFGDGAFEVEAGAGSGRIGEKLVDLGFLDRYVEEGQIHRHTMRGLIASIRLVDSSEFVCDQWIEEPTILVTRFEYANLFHTFTDWYSSYVASRVTGLPYRPHLVFVDGHCETGLEETWNALFSSVTYAKNFSGSVCFRRVILAPLGYETPLFKGLTEQINCRGAPSHELWQHPDDRRTARLSEFGEMIRASLGLPVDRHISKSASSPSGLNILFVRREDYLAHPRHKGKVQTRLSNEPEVFDSINKWGSNYTSCKLNIVNGLFAHMSMKEQVRAIQDAAVIVGAHGAGLTHIVLATPETVILEIISSEYMRPHFELIANWKGLQYHAINLEGSYADPGTVITKLRSILVSLGC